MNLEKAKEILKTGDTTCVLCLGDCVYISEKSGISPMLDYLSEGINFAGYSAADKIVGKAAALLFAKAGVCEVYGEVVSRAALPVLKRYGIACTWGTLADHIINRRGDGCCPMEETVAAIDDPEEGYEALLKKRATLRAHSATGAGEDENA